MTIVIGGIIIFFFILIVLILPDFVTLRLRKLEEIEIHSKLHVVAPCLNGVKNVN